MTSTEGQATRRSSRIAEKTAGAQAIPPELQIVTTRDGELTQKLDVEQKIGVKMEVTLSLEKGPQSITALYDLQQQVRDVYQRGDLEKAELGDWENDGPFGPPYQDPFGGPDGYVGTNLISIQFVDHPGFSTTTKIQPGEWLHSYGVQFRWTVTRKSDGKSWTSEAIGHSVSSQYAGGADAPIKYTIAKDRMWRLTDFLV
jgi:hypothetical protein